MKLNSIGIAESYQLYNSVNFTTRDSPCDGAFLAAVTDEVGHLYTLTRTATDLVCVHEYDEFGIFANRQWSIGTADAYD